jgi:hypothetical protein
MSTLRLSAYCLCGAALKMTGTSHALRVADEFWLHHTGPGHGSTDSRTAAAARRKAEREERPQP